MTNPNQDPDKFNLCFADIVELFKRSKYKIFLWMVALGGLGVLFALITPIRYESEGSLKEKKNKVDSTDANPLAQLFSSSGFSGDSEAYVVIKSRRLLSEVIKKLHLQASLEAKVDKEGITEHLKNNLILIKTVFSVPTKPFLKQIQCPLKITALNAPGEFYYFFDLKLFENGTFEVRDRKENDRLVGKGKLNEPFTLEELSFTIAQNDLSQLIIPQEFSMRITPLAETIKAISKKLKVEVSKDDKSLIKIQFENSDRHLCSCTVNCIMSEFQNYLKQQQQMIAKQQLDYLNQRRDHLADVLKQLMNKHADYLSQDVYRAGLIDSKKEIAFLVENQREYKEKLRAIEIEIKRLENMTPGNVAYYDRYSQKEGDPTVINSILAEIRALKQRRDSFEIELQKKTFNHENVLQSTFEQQVHELMNVQKYMVEIRKLIEMQQRNGMIDVSSALVNDPRFLLKGWVERLENVRVNDPSHLKKVQENFLFYLMNLERLFGVHENVIQERLTHQRNASNEYQGITLQSASELYVDYSKQMIQTEAAIRQNLFFIQQLKDPHFEITSLSAGLTDPVSTEMIRRSSDLVLQLRDSNNQSSREQERIKDELNLQRTFLAMHLEQMIQLKELHKELIEEKIYSLQNVSLELIQQQISLLEKNLQDYIQSRLQNLTQQQDLIKDHLESIHVELASMPEKWVSEQIIEQQVDSNKMILQEIVRLVESKNISNNIEVIQSAPLDAAFTAIRPKMPPVLLWGMLGMFLGGLIGSVTAIGRIFSSGILASKENLSLAGLSVCGYLGVLKSNLIQDLSPENIGTLRRLQMSFNRDPHSNEESGDRKGRSKVCLLIEGNGPHYAPILADLYLLQGMRAIAIDVDFVDVEDTNQIGLLQYLKNDVKTIPIQKGLHGDYISAGGSTLFGIEMLTSARFSQLIEELKKEYDWIFVFSKTPATSPEAEKLVSLFRRAAVTLVDESVEDLNFYIKFLEMSPESQLTFLINR